MSTLSIEEIIEKISSPHDEMIYLAKDYTLADLREDLRGIQDGLAAALKVIEENEESLISQLDAFSADFFDESGDFVTGPQGPQGPQGVQLELSWIVRWWKKLKG